MGFKTWLKNQRTWFRENYYGVNLQEQLIAKQYSNPKIFIVWKWENEEFFTVLN